MSCGRLISKRVDASQHAKRTAFHATPSGYFLWGSLSRGLAAPGRYCLDLASQVNGRHPAIAIITCVLRMHFFNTKMRLGKTTILPKMPPLILFFC
jgi:hypothetical protein